MPDTPATSVSPLEALTQFVESADPPQMMLGLTAEDDHDARVLRKAPIVDEIAEEFRASIKRSCGRVDGLAPTDYSPGASRAPFQIFTLTLADHPLVKNIVDDAAAYSTKEAFQTNDPEIGKLKFYVFTQTSSGGETASYFRIYSPKKELHHSGKWALTMREGQFNKVIQKVFLFDGQVDCFAWRGKLYVKSISNFMKIFPYGAQIQTRAAEAVDAICARIPLTNADDFRTTCLADQRMSFKLASIANRNLSLVTMPKVKALIEKHHIGIELSADESELVFDQSVANRWKILQLLDDGFLESPLTDACYEVGTKSAV